MKKLIVSALLMAPLLLHAQEVNQNGFSALNRTYRLAQQTVAGTRTAGDLKKTVATLDSLRKVCTNSQDVQAALQITGKNCPLAFSDSFIRSLQLQANMQDACKCLADKGLLKQQVDKDALSSFLKAVALKEEGGEPRFGNQGAPFETSAQRNERMKWWRDGKFGMFIHYGLFSGLAGEFQGQKIEGQAEWAQLHAGADFETYKKEAFPRFNPKPGKAAEWVKLAKEAGCAYVVLTSRHHEGFSLYNNKHSDFNIVKLRGFDLMREYEKACQDYGIKAGCYVSLLDWNHPDFDPTIGDIPYPKGNYEAVKRGERHFGHHEKYKEYLYHIVDDLLAQYHVDLVWWDYSFPRFEGDEAWGATRLMHRVFEANPKMIQNNRLFFSKNHLSEGGIRTTPTWKGDYSTAEQHVPATGIDGDWEACQTLNGTWGYSAFNEDWKSETVLIHELIDAVSRGGNYLLNIGPKPDGSIPEETTRLFKEIGKWMAVNGEAIYGTQANPFNEEFTWGRVTRKGDRELFLQVYEKPADGTISIPCYFSGKVKAVVLHNGATVKVKQTAGRSVVDLSQVDMFPHATVVKLTGKWVLD